MTTLNSSAPLTRWKSLITYLRFEYLSVALLLPLLGAATAGVPLTLFHLLGILGGAFAYHIFVSLLNDAVDLPLDRTNPARAGYPLVSGKISLGATMTIVLIQPLLAAAIIAWQSGSFATYAAMGIALGMMTIYNIWGKRSFFPPLIDVVQGIGFSSLTLYGAALSGGLTRLSWTAFTLGVIWMVLINLLGGLRDVSSDLAFGVKTTPIFFGVKPNGPGMVAPRFARIYGYLLQISLIVIGILAIAWNDLHYPADLAIGLAIASFAVGGMALFHLITLFRVAEKDYDTMLLVGFRVIGLSAGGLILIVLPALPWWEIFVVLLIFFWAFHDYSLGPVLNYWRSR